MGTSTYDGPVAQFTWSIDSIFRFGAWSDQACPRSTGIHRVRGFRLGEGITPWIGQVDTSLGVLMAGIVYIDMPAVMWEMPYVIRGGK